MIEYLKDAKLSTMGKNAVCHYLIKLYGPATNPSRDIVRDLIVRKIIHPRVTELRNYGWKAHKELCDWAGAAYIRGSNEIVCPHCLKHLTINDQAAISLRHKAGHSE